MICVEEQRWAGIGMDIDMGMEINMQGGMDGGFFEREGLE